MVQKVSKFSAFNILQCFETRTPVTPPNDGRINDALLNAAVQNV